MANENNLVQYSNRSRDEVEEIQSKGGINSGKARRKKRDMRNKMQMILGLVPQNCDDYNNASALGIDMADIDNEAVMLAGLFNEAKKGNVPAVREIRNILGEDVSYEELELKRKELQLKEKQNIDDSASDTELSELMGALTDDIQ